MAEHTHAHNTHTTGLTVVHGPHDAESWSSDLIKGLLASDHLPQNYAPAEHVALLAIIAACEHTVAEGIVVSSKIETKYKKKINSYLNQ